MGQEIPSNQLIRISHVDGGINALLQRTEGSAVPADRRYNQSEEFFLLLESEYTVPQLSIHHDVRKSIPAPRYSAAMGRVIEELAAIAPGLFREVTYYFEPSDTLHPRFFRLYEIEGRRYLFLMRLDLTYRAQEHVLLVRGTNDLTASYSSSRLYVDALFIPLDATDPGDGSSFRVNQSFSETWLGERGRGYFVQGIWIDHDLTKFFSKLFLPKGAKTYPFYPFACRYRTVCQTVIDLAPEHRHSRLPYLHQALQYIAPETTRIERDLRTESFSENLAVFREMKSALPSFWDGFYGDLQVKAYLNETGMREFRLENAS